MYVQNNLINQKTEYISYVRSNHRYIIHVKAHRGRPILDLENGFQNNNLIQLSS